MSQLLYTGNYTYTFSQLRAWADCGQGSMGYNASTIRSRYAGGGSTGNMGFAFNSWIDTACWDLAVDTGSGSVRVTSPFATSFSSYLFSPKPNAVANNLTGPWVTIDSSPSANYSFSYWIRSQPNEIWSYNSSVSYYIPTAGWEDTTYIGAGFNYDPPANNCYNYSLYYYDYYEGIDCSGYYVSGYYYGYQSTCFQSLYYGGSQVGFCYNGCPVKGTSIEMADGTHKLIEKIRVGDLLKGVKISDAPEDDTTIGWSTNNLNLTETEVRVTSIVPLAVTKTYTFNNGLFETSESHAHFIKRGDDWLFKQAKNVQVGDFLVDKDGNDIEINSIEIHEYVEGTETDPGKPRKIVYDMNVENTDTYIANGLITHNPAEKFN